MGSAPVDMTSLREQAAEYLGRVHAIADIISAAAARAEQERRLPDDLMTALHDGALFRLLLPRQYGGEAVEPATFFQTIEAVAKLDASTAWCLCQANGCAMAAAYVAPAVAEEIWGRDPAAALAWGPMAKAQAVRDRGGVRLSGTWMFASGGRHATWFGGFAPIVDANGTPIELPDGRPATRVFLFPAGQAEMTDVWDVIGLRGTGSDNYAVTDLFVDDKYGFMRDALDQCLIDAPLYRFPTTNLYATGFSATAIGIAGAILDVFMPLARTKAPRLARIPVRDDGAIQADIAIAKARLGAARAFVLTEVADIWEQVIATGQLTVDQRMRIRLAATFAIQESTAVADLVYGYAGATAIFASSPFERRFRDIHTVAQQVQGRKSNFQSVGAYLFGHPADLSVA